MLVLSRRVGESVVVGDDVTITVLEVRGDVVRVGIDAPRGSRWYNFDPCAFLECATAGTFGGRNWKDDPAREATTLAAVSWEEFRDFLGAGQWYE